MVIESAFDIGGGDHGIIRGIKRDLLIQSVNAAVSATASLKPNRAGEIHFESLCKHVLDGCCLRLNLPTRVRRAVISDGDQPVSLELFAFAVQADVYVLVFGGTRGSSQLSLIRVPSFQDTVATHKPAIPHRNS